MWCIVLLWLLLAAIALTILLILRFLCAGFASSIKGGAVAPLPEPRIVDDEQSNDSFDDDFMTFYLPQDQRPPPMVAIVDRIHTSREASAAP